MHLNSNLLELAFEQLNGVIVIDAEARICYITKRYAQRYGYTQEGICEKKIQDIIPNTQMLKVLETKQPNIAYFFKLSNGEINAVSAFPLIDAKGKLLGAIAYSVFDEMNTVRFFSERSEQLLNEVESLKSEVRKLHSVRYSIDNIMGDSPAIRKLKAQIHQAARTHSTVLIQGETGCGKELIANAIHQLSSRNLHRLIKINCAAIPSELIESELFGYEEGAFTGAKKGGKKGKFELADKGTLMLDEINSLPLSTQVKLLRTLQEREIDRVGGDSVIPVDVRIIAVSNASLEKMVQEGTFREDLYYRLNVMNIIAPPLREHKEDIPLLVDSFIKRFNCEMGLHVTKVDQEILPLLNKYDWPGNTRELQNVIERALNFAYGELLGIEHFEWFSEKVNKGLNLEINPLEGFSTQNLSLEQQIYSLEREVILQALNKNQWNKSKTAKDLKIARQVLYKKIEKFNISCNDTVTLSLNNDKGPKQ